MSLSGSDASEGQYIWFNQTKIQHGFQSGAQGPDEPVPDEPTPAELVPDEPLPDATFPFRRLGVAQELNGTGVYLYHQIDDSILAEELWISDLQTWQPSKNISIGT